MEAAMWVLTALAVSLVAAILIGAFIGAGGGEKVAQLKAQRRLENISRARAQRLRDLARGAPIEWTDDSHLDPSLLHVKHEGPIDSSTGERP